jgi:hypothetical protein
MIKKITRGIKNFFLKYLKKLKINKKLVQKNIVIRIVAVIVSVITMFILINFTGLGIF